MADPLNPVGICNLALNRLGVTKLIESLTEDSSEAKTCALHYDRVRRRALQFAEFEFAIERATLTAATASPPDEWEYAYKWPTAALRPLNIPNLAKIETYVNEIPFRVEYASGERVIYTDQEDATLRYIFDQTDTTVWTEEFANAVAMFMAWRMAMPLTSNSRLTMELANEHRLALYAAAASSFSNIVTGQMPDAESIRARL